MTRPHALKRAGKLGVEIRDRHPGAPCTDSIHGNITDETAHLVDRGTNPETAVRAITSEAARTSRVTRGGILDSGAYGDMTVVREDPTGNIATLADPLTVVKGNNRAI